jgi:hypothetical protein
MELKLLKTHFFKQVETNVTNPKSFFALLPVAFCFFVGMLADIYHTR